MIIKQRSTRSKQLTKMQTETFLRFKRKLAEDLPDFRIEWVLPVKKNIIELRLESDKRTYRNSIKASQLAAEVEEKTGVIMIFR
jgi:hypothetical protein